MAGNTYKIPAKTSKAGGSGSSFFTTIEKLVSMDDSLTQVIHVRFLPQILFIVTLCIIYIGSRHYAEKKIRAINKLENQVEDLRADFTTLKADYMYESKQSEVARKAKELGLAESDEPPFKIVIQDE